MMTVIVKDRANRRFIVTKGAPDMLLERCRFIYIDGQAKLMRDQERKLVQQTVNTLASQALRTIAIAYRPLSLTETMNDETKAESDLTFIGLQGMIDPPRKEVKQAIAECKKQALKQ